MIRRWLVGLSCAAALFTASSAIAQQSATVVLRSGERVSGSLLDLDAQGLLVRVGGSDRRFNLNDVAVIDFSGASSYPANEVNAVQGGSHLMVLRNGQTVQGTLNDVGASGARINFRASSGERDYNAGDISRIYLARPSGSSATGTGNLTPAAGNIRVPATSRWVDTGITVQRGQTIALNTTGEVRLSSDPNDVAVPAGARSGRHAPGAPLPNALAGALIGRIGNAAPFGIGNQQSVSAPAAGRLYLMVNDDNLDDNAGEFGVTITLSGTPRRR
jgi:hypothetical protein